ncbi:hypothetical protein SteCoe_30182 [Stentor coeruleus]|uniref:ADP-ribosylation factor n=1 Tax=Stentor coeruleus TaxID=5963 RepID=A0A1R2B451_9CILI|nr:hypothetical protein SteCoe_30182 [Stentor coeruleus]
MIGLDASGKTTLLYTLRLSEVNTSFLTIGLTYETAQNHKLSIISWDIGLSDRSSLYNQFYENAEGIIFLVDSNDRSRINYAREELQRFIYNEKLRLLPLLIYANKQDIINSMSAGEIADRLGIQSNEKSCRVQSSCVITGYGIIEGLEWINKAIKNKDNDAR